MWAVAYPYTLFTRGVTEWQVAGNKKETGTPRAPLEVLGVLEHAVERVGVVDSSLQRILCQHLQTLALSSSDHLPHQLCAVQHSPAITHRPALQCGSNLDHSRAAYKHIYQSKWMEERRNSMWASHMLGSKESLRSENQSNFLMLRFVVPKQPGLIQCGAPEHVPC